MDNQNDVWKKRKVKEKNLVTDQPGNFVLFLGIFISLILGLSLRSFTQSQFLYGVVQEATRNIGPDWQVKFDKVKIYLSERYLPALGLEVTNLQITSASECFLKPKTSFNTVKVPISIVGMLFYQNPFSEIVVENLDVEFANTKPNCHQKTSESNNKENFEKKKNKISILDKDFTRVSNNDQQIKDVYIDTINIRFADKSFPDLSLNNLHIENKSEKPKIIVLKTNINLAPLFSSAIPELQTELNIEFNEFPEKLLKVSILGSLREGHFSMSLLNRIDEKKYQLQSDVKNLPIQRLLALSYLDINKDFLLKSGWVSFSLYSEGVTDNFDIARLEFKRIKLDGEFGEIYSDEVIFPLGLKNRPEKFEVKLNHLRLDSLIDLNKLFKVPEQINSFGELNGSISYLFFDNIKYEGNLEGLAFNFSGNGMRQIERIKSISFSGEFNKDGFSLSSKEIFHQNKIDGNINLVIDKEKKYNLRADIRNLMLSEKTSKLLTQISSPIVIDYFQIKANEDKVSSKIGIAKIANEYLALESVEANIESSINKDISIKIKANKLELLDKLKQKFPNDSFLMPDSLSQIIINYNSDYVNSTWKATAFNRWSSNGSWNKSGTLVGVIASPKHEWVIQGTRDEPELFQKSH